MAGLAGAELVSANTVKADRKMDTNRLRQMTRFFIISFNLTVVIVLEIYL